MQALKVNDYGLRSNMKGYLLFASSLGSLGMIKNIAQHLGLANCLPSIWKLVKGGMDCKSGSQRKELEQGHDLSELR